MSTSSKIRFSLPQAKQMNAKEDPKLAEKRNQLRSMKYNQRYLLNYLTFMDMVYSTLVVAGVYY